MEAKQLILKALEDLPEGASLEEAMERISLLYKVENGIQQAERGEWVDQEQARQQMKKWFE